MRAAEALNIEVVDAWLKGRVPGLVGTPRVSQFGGGASNWTYRLEYPGRDLVLRRPPAGTKAASAHDMGREFRVQQALRPVFPAVPEVLALCEDPEVLGVPFYVMAAVPGLILRKNAPSGLLEDPAEARRLCLAMVDQLVALHAVDYRAIGLEALAKGPGYPQRQIEGWSGRYQKARTWNVPSFAKVRGWLTERVPEDAGFAVIHNDWRFDNLVLHPERPSEIVGVLDWEMATVGDPLMELGNVLAYWVEAKDGWLLRQTRRQPSHLPGMLTRRELAAAYLERTGRPPQDLRFYEVYGLFRLAVIAQQIYYRYHHRQTRNPAFRHLWLLVHYLDRRCRWRMERR